MDAVGFRQPRTEDQTVNARVLFRDDQQRQTFLNGLELDRNELVAEAVDRYAHDHAVLVNPTCPDALVVGKHQPEIKTQGDRAVTSQRTLYITRTPDAVKILMSQSGQVDLSPSRLLVVRQAA